jgi:hypothetical protein
MLFLLRPRQTWMPFSVPRDREQQVAYNRQMQEAYASTRRVSPSAPELGQKADRDPIDTLKELAGLRESGLLTDAEFAEAKAKILGSPDDET